MQRIDKNTVWVVIVMAFTAIASFIADDVPNIERMADYTHQAWVAPLIGGLVSLGSSIAGAALANKASKNQSSAYDEAWNDYENWYEGQMNANILDRADSLSLLKRYRDWQEEAAKKSQTNAIKGGASEEAKVAYAQQANKGYADAISRIAAMGQQYKDRLSQNYMQSKFNYDKNRADMAAQGAQAVASGLANAGSAVGDILGGLDWGGKENGLPPAKSLKGVITDPTSEWDWGETYE